MYYAFIDGEYFGSAYHISYLKKRVDEDMELFNGFYATIYRGERSYCSRFYDKPWALFQSIKKDRPKLPDRVHAM